MADAPQSNHTVHPAEGDVRSQASQTSNTETNSSRGAVPAPTIRERRRHWITSPFATAIVGLVAVAVGASLQGYWATRLERTKFESTIVQDALKRTTNKQEVAKDLSFLIDTGVVRTLNIAAIRGYASTPERLPTYESIGADINIDHADGPVITVRKDQAFEYSWTSSSATACELYTPIGPSGISLNGTGGPIAPEHPWHPRPGAITALVLVCTNGSQTASDAVVLIGAP